MPSLSPADYERISGKARQHAAEVVRDVVLHHAPAQSLVIYDRRCALTEILGLAYGQALAQGRVMDFDAHSPEECIEALDQLKSGDLAVLVQSSSFRLDAFRIRVHLFARGVKVVEHPHLDAMAPDQVEIYVDACAVDLDHWNHSGRGLKAKLDQAQGGTIVGEGFELCLGGPFEDTKLNIGDYSHSKNTGGQFPIGEVFTEAKDLESVSGTAAIFAYGDSQFCTQFLERPALLQIEKGRVVGVQHSTPDLDAVLAEIKDWEGEVWVRELGFGLNRALTRTRVLNGIGSYERLCGIHLSLGAKHMIYDKPQFRKRKTKFHVDVFVDATAMYLDGEQVYSPGSWLGSEVIY